MTELLPVFAQLFVLIGLLLGGIALSSMLHRARRRQSDAPVQRPTAPKGRDQVVPAPPANTAPATPAPDASLPYTRRHALLTDAERAFFRVLQEAAPYGWHVFPQVRLANLVALKPGLRNWKPHFSRVAQKCVDFVLCDVDAIGPRLVVELDDASHARPDRQARDAFVDAALQAAGLPILHVPWQRQYDTALLADQIRAAVGLAEPALAAPAPRSSRSDMGVSLPAPRHGTPVRTEHASLGTSWACRRCGAVVGATGKFCTSCGARLEL